MTYFVNMKDNKSEKNIDSYFKEIFNRDLSLDEIVEYKNNLSQFFEILIDIDKELKSNEKEHND